MVFSAVTVISRAELKFLVPFFSQIQLQQRCVLAVAGECDEYVIRIRCLGTPLSHFAQARHLTHSKISDEYIIKKG